MPATIPQTETVLKSYFQTGDKPTQEQFEELIGTMFHLFTLAQDAADAAAADAATALARAPLALLKATTNGVSGYTIEPGEVNIASVVASNVGQSSETVRVTWDTPIDTDDYKVLISVFSSASPRQNNVTIVAQTTDYVDLRFAEDTPSSFGDWSIPSFHLCVFA